jgi:hypothetical protein
MILAQAERLAVIVGSFATAVCLIVQGVHVLRTGLVLPFFYRPSPRSLRMKPVQRVCTAGLYLAPGLAVLGVLLQAALHSLPAPKRIEEWTEGRMGVLAILCLEAALGLYLLIRPSTMMGWVQSVYPELPPEKSPLARVIVRVIGAGWIAFAILSLRVAVLP